MFLDRDGVINRERGYVYRIADFEFLRGVPEALVQIQQRGYVVVVITNQSGIGRGLYGESDYAQLTEWMLARLAEAGVQLLGVYHCPHAPKQGCSCRKPAPGLILQAQREHGLDLARSWLVGDKESDLEAARRAGIAHRVLVRSGHAISSPVNLAEYVLDSLPDILASLPVLR